jgi:hypothetical protein
VYHLGRDRRQAGRGGQTEASSRSASLGRMRAGGSSPEARAHTRRCGARLITRIPVVVAQPKAIACRRSGCHCPSQRRSGWARLNPAFARSTLTLGRSTGWWCAGSALACRDGSGRRGCPCQVTGRSTDPGAWCGQHGYATRRRPCPRARAVPKFLLWWCGLSGREVFLIAVGVGWLRRSQSRHSPLCARRVHGNGGFAPDCRTKAGCRGMVYA